MSDNRGGTLEVLAIQVSRFFGPLRRELQRESILDLFAELGVVFPPELDADQSFTNVAADARTAFDALSSLAGALISAIESDQSVGAIIAAFQDVKNAVTAANAAAQSLSQALDAVGAAGGLPGFTAAEVSAFVAGLAQRLFEWSAVTYIEEASPALVSFLDLFGIVERSEQQVGSTDPRFPQYTKKSLHLDALPRALFSPFGALKDLYGFGDSSFDGSVLFARLESLLSRAGIPALNEPTPPPPKLDVVFAELSTEPGTTSSPPALSLLLKSRFDEEFTAPGPPFTVDIKTTLDVPQGTRLILQPDLGIRLVGPSLSTVQGELTVDLDASQLDTPIVLIGRAEGSRLEIGGMTAGFGVTLTWDPNAGEAHSTFALSAQLLKGRLFVQPQNDGFLAAIFPSNGIDSSFDLGFKLDQSGIILTGSAALELTLPVHIEIGPVDVNAISVGIKIASGQVSIPLGATVGAHLGPVDVEVQDIGVNADLKFPGSGGNLGPLDVDIGFKFPTGVGIAVDAGSVHGGGFISFDPDAGRYFGALQLSIYDIAVSAFGLIETKVPGVDFSFVIVISAQFPPIQLGFGFTLNGVGGMVGINRGIDTTALGNLVRAGQSEELLFPQNVIADAPTIVRDLTSVFPATQGRYVFGPLGKLGWGTPTLITGEIGLILEIPGPVIVILGEVKCLLPKPDAALVKLNLSVDGELDFPNKTFAMDAALHDSVINGFPVSGQMAMRVTWGDQPNFVFSIGGFHPAYTPPPTFPKLQPMALDFGKQGAATITVTGFFAVTSNTVQVGGEAKLHAGGSGITLDASVSVKALFVFSPFSFEADIDASVKISFHGYGPSVHLSGLLEGPTPWHVKGEVCVSIIWWDACLGFDVTFGNNQPTSQPELDPWVPADQTIIGLRAALSDPGNWSGAALPGAVSSVTRAQGTDTLVDPVGGLTVRQKVAPVETANPLTKFGVAKVTAPISFSGVKATLGSGSGAVTLTPVDAVNEFFAPAQFFDMDDGKKLSSAGFESYQAGYLFSLAASLVNVQAGSSTPKTLTYSTYFIAGDGSITGPVSIAPPPNENDKVTAANKRSAVAKRGLTLAGTRRFVNRALSGAFIAQVPTFAIASNTTLAQVTVGAGVVRSAALIALDTFRAQNIEQAAGVQVAAIHELAE